MTRMENTEDTKKPLPNGWRWVRLGEVIAEVQAGFACGLRDHQGVAQLRMNNLDTRGNFVWDDVLRVPREANDIDQFQILPGDVLFNNTNSTELVGKSALFESYVEPIVYSNHFTRLRTVAESLLPDFLASWLNHQWQQGVFAAICNRWIGQSAVKSDKLLNLAFPLPPLSEQQRIAGVLREQMAVVETARTAARARLEAVKALPAAFLSQVFPQPGQPLPDGWRWVKLEEVCKINPRRNDITRRDMEPTSFVPMEAVDAEMSVISEIRERPFADVKKGYTYFEDGDVLFAKITPCMQNGKHAIARKLIDGIGFASTEFHVIRPAKGILAEWIHYFVRQPTVLHDATNHFTGAVGQQRVPDDFLKSLEIPLPPLDEQERIAGVLRGQMAAVEKARTAAEEELQTINALPAALLRRAFNGEL